MSQPIKIDSEGNITLNLNLFVILKVLIILALAIGARFLPIPGLTEASKICLMIFVAAAGLWITEAIPPFATAIMVIVTSTYWLGQPGGPLGFDPGGYQIFLNPVASPVLVLFFGGFILAIAATKHGFDVRLAAAFIKPFGTHPSRVLLGIILTTGVFSMFMSNTATTAMMIAILTPLLKHFEGRGPFKKAMVLAVPFAANIGGIGTIIGTPPNAVAASVLAGMGHQISFIDWMIIGVPLVAVLLVILWLLLIAVFKPKKEEFDILFPKPIEVTWDLAMVVVTFCVTVLLWLTEPLHGMRAAVVALLPIGVFTMFGIIDKHDLKKIDWDVLVLVAGGMTLGVAMKSSGLSQVLVNELSFLSIPAFALMLVAILISILLSNFMSHTSASNMLVPIAASLAFVDPRISTIIVAFSCSLAMSLPISTPPNAIAFATNTITTRELAKYGTITSVIGIAALMFMSWILMSVWG
ncbi:DASS family sodium-coupled anion symporter [bacterium]|nr:DASS family sodium-coupled anion symporter [bacterium]MBU1919880.1 DASS family sodium-coupled anion symporter [bacterium]